MTVSSVLCLPACLCSPWPPPSPPHPTADCASKGLLSSLRGMTGPLLQFSPPERGLVSPPSLSGCPQMPCACQKPWVCQLCESLMKIETELYANQGKIVFIEYS